MRSTRRSLTWPRSLNSGNALRENVQHWKPKLDCGCSAGECAQYSMPRSLTFMNLPSELMTPLRPTTGGTQTPTGPSVAHSQSPITQQYCRSPNISIPPAQWGDQDRCHDGVQELLPGPIGWWFGCMWTLRLDQWRIADCSTQVAQAQEEMAQAIQEEAHPVETEDQVPIQPEEESHREVDPQDLIHPMAVREFLHPHHRELHHSGQEEQATSRSSSTPSSPPVQQHSVQASVQLQDTQHPGHAADVGRLVQQVDLCDRSLERIRERFCESGEGVRLPRERGRPPGKSGETSGEVRGTSGEVWETSGEPLDNCKVPQWENFRGSRRKTSGEVWGTSGEVRGLPRSSG